MFFAFYDRLISEVENSKTQDPSAGAKMQKGTARLLKLNESDLAPVTGIARRFNSAFAQSENDRKSYEAQINSQSQPVYPAKLQGFIQQRQRLTDNAIQQLISSLPPASWTALHSFINDNFRLHTSTLR
jgi:hypothetical protein